MRVKIIGYTLLVFIFALLQSTVLDYFKISNVKPNLLMVLIVVVAFQGNNIEGAILGFFSGLMHDVISGRVIGLYALLGLYLGLCIGSLNKRLYKENIFAVIFFILVSTVVYEYSVYFFHTVFRNKLELFYPLRHIILPEALYNSVVSIFIYIIVYKINEWSETSKRLSRKY
ncbi:rod shape-determining protein MreD [Herbivorax sp. ANBcel31]|uniref:rod shape-determining protein MreD n=1 Tax=Herbivorax sp. ANBcel31 TaxID=3069754 RepID=UPI0027B7C063|nr:rod shape-determining protein MreD [Herbivorax sp. ANBcel31]MDQ2086275.1 rod shape-determining protein MreD [Herbivorax sp. ANBcel31]